MFKIVRIPKFLDPFFDGLREFFKDPRQWPHFQGMVLALILTFWRANVTGLGRVLTGRPHRTKRNWFLTDAPWDEGRLLQYLAWRQLHKLGLREGDTVYFIIDDSHSRKRGKKMQGVGKWKDISTGSYVWGHNFLAGTFYYRGFTVPYGARLHLKPEAAKKLGIPFRTLPELAAEMILSLCPPPNVRVVVLFDSAYMNKKVVRAIASKKGFDYVSSLPGNRNIKINGRKTQPRWYRRSIPRKEFRAVQCRVRSGKRRTFYATDCLAFIKSIGEVKIVFSRRTKHDKPLAIVTSMRALSRKEIIELYNLRWVIEQFFKDTNQLLGLGEYQTGKARGAVRHLHLVAVAYSLLVHMAIEEKGLTETEEEAPFGSFSLMEHRDRMRRLLFEDLLEHLVENVPPERVISELRAIMSTAA